MTGAVSFSWLLKVHGRYAVTSPSLYWQAGDRNDLMSIQELQVIFSTQPWPSEVGWGLIQGRSQYRGRGVCQFQADQCQGECLQCGLWRRSGQEEEVQCQ